MSTNVNQPEVVELPEQRFEYQPQDEYGRPLGGKQVIVYKTPEELAQKMAKNHEMAIRQVRKLTREQRLGIAPQENIPDDAERFEGVVEFKPRELSAAERFEISQQLNDPEKFQDARDRLLESAVGVNPAKLTQTLNEQQLYILQSRARDNYVDFVNSGVDYYDHPENRKTITDWMFKNKLAPTVNNFNYAYSKLKEAELLVSASAVQQSTQPVVAAPAAPAPVAAPAVAPTSAVDPEANPQPSAAPATRIGSESQPQAKRQSHVPSGLNDRTSSSSGSPSTPANGLSMTLADIDKLTSEQYRRLMTDPAFRKHVEALDAEALKRRQEKARQV